MMSFRHQIAKKKSSATVRFS